MGLRFRRSVTRGKTRVTLTGRGVTASRRVGPVTFSTSGRGSVRLGRGWSYVFRWLR